MVEPAEKTEEKTTKTMLPPERVGRIPMQDSRRRVEKDGRLDDISDQMMKEDARLKKPDTKPWILLNAQFESATKQFRKMTTSFTTDDRHRRNEADDADDTDGEESPGGDLGKKTVTRKDKVHASEIDHSDESWGEIRPHLDKGARQRATKNEPDRRRPSKRDSLDPNLSSRKRDASHNSL